MDFTPIVYLFLLCGYLGSTRAMIHPCFQNTVRKLQPCTKRFCATPQPAVAKVPFTAKSALFFPGQGAQHVGMASDACGESEIQKNLFDYASKVVGYDLLKVCQKGPREMLDRTDVCQPAIFTASIAAYEKHKNMPDVKDATVALGLSLGEYSALCAAEAISFEDGVRVTKARGEAMQAAAEASDSGMVAVIGLDAATVNALAQKASQDSGDSIAIANYLCPGNYVLSGSSKACLEAEKIAKPEFKARMTVRLAVAGAFHTSYMEPAVNTLRAILDTIEIRRPRIPIISNVDAMPHVNPSEIRNLLLKQVTHPVRFEESLRSVLASDFGTGFEIGPGNVISGLIKRLDKQKGITSLI